MNKTKQERMETVNKLVVKISSLSRRFFYYEKEQRVAKFIFKSNRLYWVDEYTQRAMYAYGYKYLDRYFSNGGTLRALVLDFSHYIRTGEQSNGKNGYGGLHAYAWGYPLNDQKEIIAYAKEIGYLDETFSDEPYRMN